MSVSSSAPDWAIYGGRCRDLIGQPVYGLAVLIGWEPRARSLARTFQNVLRLLTHVLQLVTCACFLEGSSGVVATASMIVEFLVVVLLFKIDVVGELHIQIIALLQRLYSVMLSLIIHCNDNMDA